MRRLLALAMLLLVLPIAPVAAVEQPTFAPVIGTSIDLGTELADSSGEVAPLRQWMAGRPALVIFGYDACPNLCGVVQQVVATALGRSGLDPASYVPLFVTIDPAETPADAAGARARLADAAGAAVTAPWRFLTGAGVDRLAEAFGIGAIERARIAQFVHPVAVFALTPDGRIARVLPGLDLAPRDLRLALVEASAGKLGSLIDHIILFCAGYDASKGQYTSLVEAGLRIASAGLLVVGAGGLLLLRRAEKRA